MIKKIIYIFFSYLIRFNFLLIRNKIKSNYLVNSFFAFGDCFTFYIQNYNQIINKGYKIITVSNFEKKIAELFFERNKIYNIFFSIPSYISIYSIGRIIKKYLTINRKFDINYKKKIGYEEKKILEDILRKKHKSVSAEIKKLKKIRYVLFFVKHFNENINDIKIGPHRQTSDIKTIFKVVNFLINKKINIVVLGNKREKIINILKKFSKNKSIIYFNEISKNASIIDQLFLHYHSKFSIGTDCGAFIMSIFLKKKILFFNSLKNNDGLQQLKNITFLHKKVIINKKNKFFLSEKLLKILSLKNINYSIKESTFLDIKKSINKIL